MARKRPTAETSTELEQLDSHITSAIQALAPSYKRKGELLDLLWGTGAGSAAAARDEAGMAWLKASVQTAAGRSLGRERAAGGGYGFDRATGGRAVRIARRAVVMRLLGGTDATDAEWARVEGLSRSGGVGKGTVGGTQKSKTEHENKRKYVRTSDNLIPELGVQFVFATIPGEDKATRRTRYNREYHRWYVKNKAEVKAKPVTHFTPPPKPQYDTEIGEIPEGPAPFTASKHAEKFREFIKAQPQAINTPQLKELRAIDDKFAGIKDDNDVDEPTYLPPVDHVEHGLQPAEVNVRPPKFENLAKILELSGNYNPYADS